MITQKLSIPLDRSERLQYIRRLFPQAKGVGLQAHFYGGRRNALNRLNEVDAVAYNHNRNFTNGAVTRLSPYLRHGCLTLKETVAYLNNRFGAQAEKLVFELAWRDYWRQVWYVQGQHILSDLEAPKVALGRKSLPDSVKNAQTGLACMDAFIHDLVDDGYVHNHGRMWFAAYVVHWLKVDWREAADWYESYLLDGDQSSNHLSWQWIASTNSAKPYYFNKENLARYTAEKYCLTCKADCPFDKSYEALQTQLFGDVQFAPLATAKAYPIKVLAKHTKTAAPHVAILVHDEMLSPTNVLLSQPFSKVFVFDTTLHGDWSINRLQFMADCLSEMEGVEVWMGDTRQVLQALNVGQVITQNTPNPNIKALLQAYSPKWEPEPRLVDIKLDDKSLKRFSRYWQKVGPILLGDASYKKP